MDEHLVVTAFCTYGFEATFALMLTQEDSKGFMAILALLDCSSFDWELVFRE
jgi:hypothetical protein